MVDLVFLILANDLRVGIARDGDQQDLGILRPHHRIDHRIRSGRLIISLIHAEQQRAERFHLLFLRLHRFRFFPFERRIRAFQRLLDFARQEQIKRHYGKGFAEQISPRSKY
ncbi:hypothetical protein D3C76_1590770 [compost metagenome]